MGSLSLLQGIFPTQGSNPGLLHCRWILYQLSHKGSLRRLEWVAYPFSSRPSRPRNWTRVSRIAGRFFTNWAIREARRLYSIFIKAIQAAEDVEVNRVPLALQLQGWLAAVPDLVGSLLPCPGDPITLILHLTLTLFCTEETWPHVPEVSAALWAPGPLRVQRPFWAGFQGREVNGECLPNHCYAP